jgi:NAD+ kinase
MVIGLYGRSVSIENMVYVQRVVDKLLDRNCRIYIFKPLFENIRDFLVLPEVQVFETHPEVVQKIDYLFSIGGDGTILDAMTLVRNSGIPIMGINIGRLGFLSSISKDEILAAVDKVLDGDFRMDSRALVRLSEPPELFGDLNYALNEVTITRKDSTSLITLDVYINDVFLNTYWADGLIISTPTGSTAYSLSTGGPILVPGSENFVITPIAPHNLTVRPVVIPDKSRIRIMVEGREQQFLVSLDSRRATLYSNFELIIEKADFKINLVQMKEKHFFSTLRDKLKWGLDARN